MFQITTKQLTALMPQAPDPATWVAALNAAMSRFSINSQERGAAFLAQIAHESGELRRLSENLNYSASGLMKTWPNRFPTPEKAKLYERNPQKIANFVYAKRLGNGDEASGDGWTFRGRGLMQITGRGNYRSTGAALGLPLEQQPELLEQPATAALSAAHFWQSRGLNELADDRNDDDDNADFVKISIIINGGRTGLTERIAYWKKAKAVLAA